MKDTDIWITGLGAATPLGHTYADFADNLLAGKSGIRTIDFFDASQHPCQIGGWIDTIPLPPDWNVAAFRELDRHQQLPLWCCGQALRDAGLWDVRGDLRVGLVLGNSGEWPFSWEMNAYRKGGHIIESGREKESMGSFICRHLGFSGPRATISAACASANLAVAQARRWLQLGIVEVCLAGASDMAVTPLSMAGFGNLRALSRRNDNPQGASRPFDIDRDGFVLGEGGVIFALETAARARKRKAHVYAQVAGCGASSDAYNMVMPSPDPQFSIQAVQTALADAEVNPADIDYINAHATSTPTGDVAEARVLASVLNGAVDKVPVSSTKSMTGHLLTAAAAIEAMACLVAMERGALPPTINLDKLDPECNQLNHVANESRPAHVRVAVSNSFGFGGSNTCLVLKAA